MKFYSGFRFRLTVILLCVALIPLLGLSLFQLNQFDSAITNRINSEVTKLSSTNSDRIDQWVNSKILQLTETLKAYPEFATMDIKEVKSYLEYIKQSDPELEIINITDENGIDADNMDGSQLSFFTVPRDTKSLFIEGVVTSEVTNERTFVISAPMYDTEEFSGVLFSVIKLKALEDIVDQIKVGETGYAYIVSSEGKLIYHPKEEWIGTNIKDVLELDSDKVLSDEIITKDSGLVKFNDIDGEVMIEAFSKIPSTDWRLVVTAPYDEIYAKSNNLKSVTSVLILTVTILVILISTFISSHISKPIKYAAEHMQVLANADFTKGIEKKYLGRTDEIGLLTKEIDSMSNSIREVLHNVIEETRGVLENVTTSSRDLNKLVANIEEVSATTEEMSAGLEETAASAEEMNATSMEIANSVESVAKKALEGSTIVEEISKRAQNLKDIAVASQKKAHELRQVIDNEMRTSLEQSKEVEKINALTDSILQITSQTNLLALNAAIEAARAGEAGKGFAVVADEIRKLADSSKETVNEIQDITKIVVSSVEGLIQSSQKIIDFIDSTVIHDYQSMVDTGEQYYKDAESVQDMVTDFSATSEELLASIQSILKAINEVTMSNNEGAVGAQNIAEKASEVMSEAAEVITLMKQTETSSKRLAESVSKFKI